MPDETAVDEYITVSPEHELLLKAYPQGYLTTLGNVTVGGWVCTKAPEEELDTICFCHPKIGLKGMGTFRSDRELTDALEAGELLPSLTDPGTWETAKRDLAHAFFGGEPASTWATGLTWSRCRSGWLLATAANGHTSKIIIVSTDERDNTGMGSTALFLCPGVNIEDGVAALVVTRAKLREHADETA